MAKMTPEQEAHYALEWDLPGDRLPLAAQLEYERLKPGWEEEKAANARARARAPGPAPGHRVSRDGSVHIFSSDPHLRMVAVISFAVMLVIVCATGVPYFAAQSGSNRWGGIVFVGLLAGSGGWLVFRLARLGVIVRDGKVTIRNFLRTRKVSVDQIRGITVEMKPEPGPHNALRPVPRMELTNSRRIWLEGLALGWGKPQPGRPGAYEEFRALIGHQPPQK